MKKINLILLFALFCNNLKAQTDSLRLSLAQAVETGLKNRFDVQANKYHVLIAEDEISKSKKEWIPEISGSANLRYFNELQATFLPGGFYNDYPSLFALGANANTVFALDLHQSIYKPGITSDVKLAKNNVALETEKNIQSENNIREAIAESYLNVLLKELQYRITQDDEQRYKEYLDVAEGKYKLGSMIENDYLKAKLDYENSKIESQKAKQNYDLSYLNLKYQLNVTPETGIVLTDALNSYENPVLAKPEATNRTEIKQLILQKERNGLLLDKTKQNALPSLSLYANYSEQFTYSDFSYNLSEWWSPFNYLGISLTIPITSNFKNHSSIKSLKTKDIQLDLDYKQKTADINYEIGKATTELNNALENMKTTKSNYDLSKSIYENQKLQYGYGSVLYSNLLDTEKSLSTAERNYIKSVYDYLTSQISYNKAIGVF